MFSVHTLLNLGSVRVGRVRHLRGLLEGANAYRIECENGRRSGDVGKAFSFRNSRLRQPRRIALAVEVLGQLRTQQAAYLMDRHCE